MIDYHHSLSISLLTRLLLHSLKSLITMKFEIVIKEDVNILAFEYGRLISYGNLQSTKKNYSNKKS